MRYETTEYAAFDIWFKKCQMIANTKEKFDIEDWKLDYFYSRHEEGASPRQAVEGFIKEML